MFFSLLQTLMASYFFLRSWNKNHLFHRAFSYNIIVFILIRPPLRAALISAAISLNRFQILLWLLVELPDLVTLWLWPRGCSGRYYIARATGRSLKFWFMNEISSKRSFPRSAGREMTLGEFSLQQGGHSRQPSRLCVQFRFSWTGSVDWYRPIWHS